MPKPVKVKVTKAEFRRYLRVQQGGKYNMFDPRAQQATGLSNEKYTAIIEQYEDLYDKYARGERG